MARRKLSGTLTIRLSPELRRKLSARSATLGETPSSIARERLETMFDDSDGKTLGERTGKYIGSVSSREVAPGRDAREALEDWSPDRRG